MTDLPYSVSEHLFFHALFFKFFMPFLKKSLCETVRTICNLLYVVSIILFVSSQSIAFLYNVVSILCNR